MKQGVGLVERAFELARSGRHETIMALKIALKVEGYHILDLDSPMLLRQLKSIIRLAIATTSKST